MKLLSLFVLVGLFATGCASQHEPAAENGNGLGGANVAGSFPGSSGAGAKATTGSSQGSPSTDPKPQ